MAGHHIWQVAKIIFSVFRKAADHGATNNEGAGFSSHAIGIGKLRFVNSAIKTKKPPGAGWLFHASFFYLLLNR